MRSFKWLAPAIYIVFLLLPIYWLLNMSFKTTNEILGAFSLWPQDFTLANYRKIFTDSTWYGGYLNSLAYVAVNTVLSVAAALPAAYAFSRYHFLGDKHLFFWLLTNRMAPPAVFALPFFQLYSALHLFDTHIAVALAPLPCSTSRSRSGSWKASCRGCPRSWTRPAYVDGYSFPRFFVKIFIPTITAGIGVTAFFCFMFSWVEHAAREEPHLGGGEADRRDDDPHREHRGLRAGPARGGGRPDHRAGRVRHLLRAPLHREGILAGPGVGEIETCPSHGWRGPGRRRRSSSASRSPWPA